VHNNTNNNNNNNNNSNSSNNNNNNNNDSLRRDGRCYLRRIFVTTPPHDDHNSNNKDDTKEQKQQHVNSSPSIRIQLHPIIRHEAHSRGAQRVGIISCTEPVYLPMDSFICIYLPAVFLGHSKHSKLQPSFITHQQLAECCLGRDVLSASIRDET